MAAGFSSKVDSYTPKAGRPHELLKEISATALAVKDVAQYWLPLLWL